MIELPRSNRTGCTGVSTAVIYCKVNDRFRWYYFVSLHIGRIKVFVKEKKKKKVKTRTGTGFRNT